MAKNKSYEINMCEGPLLGKMLLFALPLMFSSILQLLFNAADVIVVGRFVGDNALAAVGSNVALINLLVNFFMGLSVGANVLAARYYAAKEQKALSDTIHTAIFVSIISGIFLTIFGVIAAKQLLITKDYSIGRIAADCGFSSQSYFNYSFKKRTGLSPLKYRKKMLSQIDI